MNILDQIIDYKRKEVSENKRITSIRDLEQGVNFSRPTLSLRQFIRNQDKSGIIAEFKRRSPSRGVINANAPVGRTTRGYADAGASALSVLTDQKFFGGSNDDLVEARKNNSCPILRKDFTIDEYQIVEAKAIGADAILLIAAVLLPEQSAKLAEFAHGLGMEVLLEVHNEQELRDNLGVGADLIGVNNRDLKTFSVSTDVSKKLSALIPSDVVKVSESGISTPEAIVELRHFGYEGFLVGENFMKEAEPEKAAASFIRELKRQKINNG
jgi:indole-3-glycerol phosphate synthase